MLRAFVGRLRDVALYSPTDRFELYVSLLSFLWGVILLNPYASAFASSPTFATMAGLAPEWVWGAGALAASILSLAALALDHRVLRRWVCFGHGLAWFFIAVSLGQSNPAGTGWAAYGLVSATAFLTFARHAPRRPMP